MLEAQLIGDVGDLDDAAVSAWDRLAVAMRQPMAAPAWMLGWWRHAAPPGAQLRLVVVRDRDEVVGIAPFFADRGGRRGRLDYRLLGGEMPRTSPLAVPGREWEVAEAIGRALAEADPRPDAVALESMPLASHWAVALRDTWPGPMRPVARQYFVQGSPVITLAGGSFDAWLAAKSRSFRSSIRQGRRHLEAAGAVSRVSTEATLRADVEAFVQLHAARWEGRGESPLMAIGAELAPMLEEIGRALLPSGRFWIRLLEVDGEPAAAQLYSAAGGDVVWMNSGWDERFASLRPVVMALADEVEASFARGDRRLDLAPGEDPYKLRFADANDPVAWTIMLVPGRRLALAGARTAPMLTRIAVREAARRALTDEQQAHLRRLLSRARRGDAASAA
jgi:CelD/BcsL family acetyltransferase involved in cellulose biosynthesis